MTDPEEVVFLSTTATVETNIERAGANPHTRLPLVGANPEMFRGTVYVPSVLDCVDELWRGAVTFEDIATTPMTIPAETPVSEVVDQFQTQYQELALVTRDTDAAAVDSNTETVGPGAGVVGLVTATDALEAIVGETEDPLDLERG
ncbi:MAG: CBS domain protein [halophilic archaeon J07HX64]|jgi:Hemolysins and related proteins containing CBS domains|nr:MAG: CBS domain protein [halophilic archaeon J07HX64]